MVHIPLTPALAALLTTLLACCSPDVVEQHADHLDKPSYHDYGTLPLGTKKTHDIEIPIPSNEHGDVIVADSFHGNCSCSIGMVMIAGPAGRTRAVYGLPDDQRKVGKGEKVILRLTLDTKDMEPVDVPRTRSVGSIRFQLVSGDDHARYESKYIQFDYGVKTPIKVAPVAHVDFGFLPLCRTFPQTLELSSNLPGETMQLGEISVSHDCITAKLEGEGDKRLLKVKITPTRNLERQIRGGIAMPTGRADYPFLRIGVSGTFVGDIQYMPAETLSFDMFDFRKTKEQFVNLLDHDSTRPSEFVIRSFNDKNGNDISKHFNVEFQPLSGRQIRVNVKYLGTMGGMRMGGELSLAKTEGGPQVARLMVSGYNSAR